MTTETPHEGISGGLARSVADFNVEGLASATDTSAGRRRTLNPSAMRELLPIGGLREYWYPAIVDHKIGRRRPSKIKLLDQDIVLYRGKKGQVIACAAVCPHRGGSLGDGHCHYSGTISCPYHGWTFDESGDCVAVLGEGPESPIPGNEGARLKIYPTVTLKGCVFIWMGEGDPAPLEEDIPPEFFSEETQVQFSVSNWSCNWRQAIENILDAHAFYVHKDSVQLLRAPENQVNLQKLGPTRGRPRVVNGRGLTWRLADFRPPLPEDATYRDAYPGLGGELWPKHEFVRLHWAKLMSRTVRFRPKMANDPPWRLEEWSGFHLPIMFRAFDFGHSVYTRCAVPVTSDSSRMFYYYTTYGRSAGEKLINKLWFTFVSNWWLYYNFSGQDQAVMEPQVYNLPEALSATDVFPLGIRRLVVERARDFQEIKPTN